MDEQEFEVRLLALEKAFKTLKTAQQEPLIGLIDWAMKERINELGRTRGRSARIGSAGPNPSGSARRSRGGSASGRLLNEHVISSHSAPCRSRDAAFPEPSARPR